MIFIKKVYYKLEYLIYFYFSLMKIKSYRKRKKCKIYLMGVPVHGNLGDQAIIIAEREFLNRYFADYEIIEIESEIVTRRIDFLKKNVDDSLILIHGGGFIGSIWPKEDEMAKMIIKNFENNIIILPQTVFFDRNEGGRKLLKSTGNIFESKTNLDICLREEYSFGFMKKVFGSCNNYLIPDMVLFLKPMTKWNNSKHIATLCLRSDIEKTFSEVDRLTSLLKRKGYHKLNITDTVIERRLYPYNRIKKVKEKIEEFSKSDIVITDRLHGMVFAYLANTPCIVINSKSHKVRGVYNWIKEVKYIEMIDNLAEFSEAFDKVMKGKRAGGVDLDSWYGKLRDIIKMRLD